MLAAADICVVVMLFPCPELFVPKVIKAVALDAF